MLGACFSLSNIKGALRSFREDIFDQMRKIFVDKLNQQAVLKGQHNFILFYFVDMWRTLPPF